MPNPFRDPNKEILRQSLRRISVTDPVSASALIVSKISEILSADAAIQHVALFSAIHNEPDLLPLFGLFPERHFVLPRIENDTMEFHRVTSIDNLVPGVWGIREPSLTAEIIAPDDIDLFLCPGMAFTLAGHRLGKGKGYYDRYLARVKHPLPPRIGVTFQEFILPTLPHQAHDITMDHVIYA